MPRAGHYLRNFPCLYSLSVRMVGVGMLQRQFSLTGRLELTAHECANVLK
jgi:hypothetical protein